MEFKDFVTEVNDYKKSLLAIGSELRQAKNNYKEMVGEGINSWHDFLAQPEVGLSVREANGLIKLLEWTEGSNLPIEDLNLSTARFASSKGIPATDDMKVLALKDWKELHHEEKTNNAKQTYSYMVMKRSKETGTLSRVYGVEDLEETIKNRIDE